MTDIYFRTDGNSEIATGHLVRCLAIARACARRGANVKFIVSDQESLTLLEERFTASGEFAVLCLERNYREIPSEIPSLLSCLSTDMHTEAGSPAANGTRHKPWIFIDSYHAAASYFRELRSCFHTAYLDDLRNLDCAVDLVVNYDTSEDCSCYKNASRKLLGVQYTPLREQFHAPCYEVRREVTNILLSTGGTDPYQVAESILRIIYEPCHTCSITPLQPDNASMHGTPESPWDMALLQSMHFHILTSMANTRYTVLAALAQSHPQIHIHTNVSDVAALMTSCDLAVSAGGTTLCELCAVGVPSVSYLMAENQRTAVKTYAGLKLIPYAGDIRPAAGHSLLSSAADANLTPCAPAACNPPAGNPYEPNINVLRRILAFLLQMAQDHPARACISSAMRNFHDGAGADRIAAALLQE